MTDNRQKPWRKLRAVVEITVPPTSRASEKDLAWLIRDRLPREIVIERRSTPNARPASVRVKAFGPFYRAEKIKERRK